jgi:mannosyltransferase OCH1-like enzyme
MMDTWCDCGSGFRYLRFDDHTAQALIEEHFGARHVDLYRVCALPAMRSDFFRYCALWALGGIYADADTVRRGPINELCGSAGARGLLVKRLFAPWNEARIINDIMFMRRPRDPLMRYAINFAGFNIRNRPSNNVWQITGPALLTQLYDHVTAENLPDLDGFAVIEEEELVRRFVKFGAAEYQNFDHWFEVQKHRNVFVPGWRPVPAHYENHMRVGNAWIDADEPEVAPRGAPEADAGS